MSRDKYTRQSLGAPLQTKIKDSRVLLVGAGGIGCELLKDLVLTGFGEIHIIDLDTIDLSNLNRQFLFRHEHIKKPKAVVAKESASKFNRSVRIEAHHANIKDPQFDLGWFSSFTIVFNALDNIDARRHVNKMCIAADVPLIESGTTGFNGQVQAIRRGKTECYDCNAKETPRSFPVCTIRSTPSQPIHCIVWAKSYLFAEIFGIGEEDPQDFDHSEDAENKEEIEKLREEALALKKIRASMGTEEFPRLVFEKVFTEDIERLRSMADMWISRDPPQPLIFQQLNEQIRDINTTVEHQDQVVWSLAENFAVFTSSLRRLSDRLREMKSSANGDGAKILSFDKDDKDTLDFVASSSNLRSIIFHIEARSEFDIKQMAGNIIPAIATTNAMVAGLCVLQALKVLRDDLAKARMVFLTTPIVDRIISAEPLRPPNPQCPVCSAAQAKLRVDLSRATVQDLTDALKHELGYGDEISIATDDGILYDPDLDDNLPKKLADLSIEVGTFLTITDESDAPRVDLRLAVIEQTESGKTIDLPSKPELGLKATQSTRGEEASQPNGDVANGTDGLKRKRSLEQIDAQAEQDKKRKKLIGTETGDPSDDLILVDDTTNGAIVIDD